MTSAGGPVPAGTLRMVRAMACAYDAHRIHTDGVRGGGTEKGSAMTAMPPNDRFDRFDRFSKLVPRFDHLKWKMAAAGILVGLISGFLVVLYRLGIEYGTDTARWIYARIREPRGWSHRGRSPQSQPRSPSHGWSKKSRWPAAAAFRKPTAW